MKSSDAKASKCRLKFSSKMSIFIYFENAHSYIYVQLFYFNSIEKDLHIAITVKLLNLNIGAK